MAFENCTGRFKLVFLKNFVELYKVLSRTASVNVIAFSVLKYYKISFPCKSVCLQITADVGKITKYGQRFRTFIFTELSENVLCKYL